MRLHRLFFDLVWKRVLRLLTRRGRACWRTRGDGCLRCKDLFLTSRCRGTRPLVNPRLFFWQVRKSTHSLHLSPLCSLSLKSWRKCLPSSAIWTRRKGDLYFRRRVQMPLHNQVYSADWIHSLLLQQADYLVLLDRRCSLSNRQVLEALDL